jgi:hypothetical protein
MFSLICGTYTPNDDDDDDRMRMHMGDYLGESVRAVRRKEMILRGKEDGGMLHKYI